MKVQKKTVKTVEAIEAIEMDVIEHRKYVAERLAFLRRDKSLNMKELAAKIGCDAINYRSLESGRVSISHTNLSKVCVFYNCESKDILGF